jgi:hypothetical protein
VDGNQPGLWQPIGGMGHDSCVWCKLREDAAAGGGTSTRVRLGRAGYGLTYTFKCTLMT